MDSTEIRPLRSGSGRLQRAPDLLQQAVDRQGFLKELHAILQDPLAQDHIVALAGQRDHSGQTDDKLHAAWLR